VNHVQLQKKNLTLNKKRLCMWRLWPPGASASPPSDEIAASKTTPGRCCVHHFFMLSLLQCPESSESATQCRLGKHRADGTALRGTINVDSVTAASQQDFDARVEWERKEGQLHPYCGLYPVRSPRVGANGGADELHWRRGDGLPPFTMKNICGSCTHVQSASACGLRCMRD
jgi:hypothetical protein